MSEALKHFLEAEIEITSERLKDTSNQAYDGVFVGAEEAKKLKENHIRFCKQLLKMINK